MKKKLITFFIFFIINYCSAQLFSGPFYFSVDKINDEISISSNIPKDHYLYYDKLLVTDSKNKKIELDKYPLSKIISDPLGEDVKVIQDNFEINIKKELGIKEINIYFQGCNKTSCFLPGSTNINLSSLVSDNIDKSLNRANILEFKDYFFC